MKVVINCCYGGYGLSDDALKAILERKGEQWWERESKFKSLMGNELYRCPPEEYDRLYEEAKASSSMDRYREANAMYVTHGDYERWDPDLIAVVEEMGEASFGRFSRLEIVDIPFDDGEGWYIDEYDGMETIHEDHRSWG